MEIKHVHFMTYELLLVFYFCFIFFGQSNRKVIHNLHKLKYQLFCYGQTKQKITFIKMFHKSFIITKKKIILHFRENKLTEKNLS